MNVFIRNVLNVALPFFNILIVFASCILICSIWKRDLTSVIEAVKRIQLSKDYLSIWVLP